MRTVYKIRCSHCRHVIKFAWYLAHLFKFILKYYSQDNLESTVYEVFEKDPIKYHQYQIAIQQALLDRVSESEKLTKETYGFKKIKISW